MFLVTYRNTFKTLLRSVTFWLVFLVYSAIMIRYGVVPHVTYQPGYEPLQLSFSDYTSMLDNTIFAGSLIYPLAILTVITTTLVLNRDYGDSFYEIEKAAGVKPSRYLFGRLGAVVSIAFVSNWVLTYLALQIGVVRDGGVEGLSLLQYVGDSLFRLTRANLCVALPYILFYVGITYLLGSLFKSGIVASVGGFICAISYFVINLLYRFDPWTKSYIDYLSPQPNKLRYYFRFIGLENKEMMYARFETSLSKALLCIGFLTGVFAVCAAVSYARLRKRET